LRTWGKFFINLNYLLPNCSIFNTNI
jgi:AAA domain